MSETWYLRDSSGAACGPGTREALIQTIGSSVQEPTITTERTWNRTEAAGRQIQAGTWTVTIRAKATFPGADLGIKLERRNSSCVVQQTIIDSTISCGTTYGDRTRTGTPGIVTFDAGDILTLLLWRDSGTGTLTIRYNDADPDDSLVDHPDEVAVTVKPAWYYLRNKMRRAH